MNHNLTPMKLISMTCEHSIAQRALALLEQQGVKSVRASSIRIEDFGSESSVDLNDSQEKLEFIVHPEKVQVIISEFSKQFLSRFDVGFYVSDVQVLRPEIFCK